jgi:membrane protein DedA with SNARE-associated domain
LRWDVGGHIEDLLQTLSGLPPALIYLIVGAGAAIENIVPPVPADTFVLFGAFLAAGGRASAWAIFLVTWMANVITALGVYELAYRHGERLAGAPIARWLLKPHQIQQISRFYVRFGVPALALSRFLPAFRAVVPVFAGLSRMPWYQVLPSIAVASGLWYGILVVIGTVAGHNWELVAGAFAQFNRVLLWIAIPLLIIVVVWWWRTRREQL